MALLHESAAIARRSDERLLPLLRLFRFVLAVPAMPLAFLWRRLKSGSRRRSAERYLRTLPDAILSDIGIARSEISYIASEPPEAWGGWRNGARLWRGPDHQSSRIARRRTSRRR